MKVGVVFPQTEIGAGPGGVREYVQAAEELGYDHLLVYDHVIGANPASRPGWRRPYSHKDMFHEPFVLFGYLAAITQRIELVTGVIIMGQRQATLVAKQTAEVDVLSGGRLRLGIGVGWNEVEYEALGENFQNRGRRVEEQIEVMRALWTQEVVTFEGRWHRITDAGINPLPIQRPIPLWIGGSAEAVLRRIARMADGWFPLLRPDDRAKSMIDQLHSYVREAGRDPKEVGIEGSVSAAEGTVDDWVRVAKAWESLGATHLSFNTMNAGFTSTSQHIDAVRRFKQAMG